jgi:DNA repair exonuclease SbcCD ATPase subunit
MSDNNLIVDLIKESSQDIKSIKEDVTQLKVDHKEISTAFKSHIKNYSSDKQRLNNSIEYANSIGKTVEKKFDNVFITIEDRVSSTEEKLTNIEESIGSLKYWDKVSKIAYTTGGTIIGALGAIIAWLFKYGDTVIK